MRITLGSLEIARSLLVAIVVFNLSKTGESSRSTFGSSFIAGLDPVRRFGAPDAVRKSLSSRAGIVLVLERLGRGRRPSSRRTRNTVCLYAAAMSVSGRDDQYGSYHLVQSGDMSPGSSQYVNTSDAEPHANTR